MERPTFLSVICASQSYSFGKQQYKDTVHMGRRKNRIGSIRNFRLRSNSDQVFSSSIQLGMSAHKNVNREEVSKSKFNITSNYESKY